ncbi:MAG: hypothetical protein NUV53_00850 [Patescibacteria group bacterium]|nr:hypothetical protein [Patescibacteria group bacterium]
MKTLTGGFTAILFFAYALVGAFASGTPITFEKPKIPEILKVGKEGKSFFRKEGAKLVKSVGWGFGCTDIDGISYDLVGMFGRDLSFEVEINADSDWSESEAIEFPRKLIAAHFRGEEVKQGILSVFLALPSFFAAHPKADYGFGVNWGNEITGYQAFRYNVDSFKLIQGTDGTWSPPAWVLGDISLGFVNSVFVRYPGLQRARLRWWTGTEFIDSNPGYSYRNVRLANVGKKSEFEGSPYSVFVSGAGVLALPAKPIFEQSLGILTLEFWDDVNLTGIIARYDARTGTRLMGEQEEREPLITAIRWTPQLWDGKNPAAEIFVSGEAGDEVVFEQSQDLIHWQSVPLGPNANVESGTLGVHGALKPLSFFRTRYNR